MEGKIYTLDEGMMKSFAVVGNELWMSANKVSSLEKFEKELQKTGLLKSAESLSLSTVHQVSFNEKSSNVKLKYNLNDKEKSKTLTFDDAKTASVFGHFLGQKLSLSASESQESQSKAIWNSVLPLLISVVFAVFFAVMNPGDFEEKLSSEDGYSRSDRRNRLGKDILGMIYNTIGKTGIVLICVGAIAFFAYKMYQRFKNPAKITVYQAD